MVVAGVYKVGGYSASVGITHLIAKMIPLGVKRLHFGRTGYGHPLYGYALLLIQVYGIGIKIGECLLGVTAVLVEPLLQYALNTFVNYLVKLKVFGNLLPFSIDTLHRNGFHLRT